ncbi:acyl-CoA dehydrogenase family protein [Actinosynnema pretiosum subsp. pretiosum]|uniref:Acyl-CoA dehydrogenase type 2 domain protein n=2 Tax=Actinosynnema TaxID=40566 RepID=C6WG04_ACTMD|nr:acyl-CoA dehydrogenase family protein [Actinosynnema mirum]ACU37940.1 acyl-CoA dehydrogenase type 2 domain protein [Actinosynnema mirum DSM 43827]AXX31433.1 Acyl-CoA dehydrogenase, type 2, C-terminal domain [Actinosynnema pretiosum subsp. pretiosum]QUF04523.1 acyl-CoA dehydrogenase family protein [Actinosynnema pretiosum subsp. pretiosum]
MTTTEAPGRTELAGRAAELVPLIREHAAWQEEHRALHPDVLAAVRDAGLLKMRVPLRYGGFESDVRTVCDVVAELARGDGSVGWTANTQMLSSWLIGLFPDEVQDEVFADPDVFVGSSVSPNGVATPAPGGVVVNGEWAFSTGVLHSGWFAHSALLAEPDGGYAPIVLAIPVADLGVVDDWHTVGMRGTGSVKTVAKDLFVPQARVLPLMPVVLHGAHLSERNADSATWRAPFSPVSAAVAGAVPLGMARAAREVFLERLPGRKITYTDYESQAEAPLTHLQVARATLKVDQAAFHVQRAADRVDGKVRAGEAWSVEERAVARMDMGAATALAKEAVDLLSEASGGSSIYTDRPIQRIARDVRTINLHGVLHPNTNLELYGRVLCGLEPNTHLF